MPACPRSFAARHQPEFEFITTPSGDWRPPHDLRSRALLRWRHPDRGLPAAEAFITWPSTAPPATTSRTGSVSRCSATPSTGREPGSIAAESTSVAPAAGARVRGPDAISATGREPDPRAFTIELTESAWTLDSTETLAVMEDLRAAGLAMAIDDFGAGFFVTVAASGPHFHVVKLDPTLLRASPATRPRSTSCGRSLVGSA